MRRALPFLLPLLGMACVESSIAIFDEDAGAADAGLRDASALSDGPPTDRGASACPGAAPSCYAGWSGSSDCCLEPGSPAECIDGVWACSLDLFGAEECARIDPVCEGSDMGPPGGLYDDCGLHADCTLTPNTCCGVCGAPSAEDLAAVDHDREEDYYFDVACPEARDDPPICPDCPSALNPHLVASCDPTGFRPACTVVDLAEPRFTGCVADSDCVLRTRRCCPCGDIPEYDTIAVSKDADVDLWVCEADEVCPDCLATYDPSLIPICESGRCVVARD